MINMQLIADKATGQPVLLRAAPRPSSSQQSRYRCVLVAELPEPIRVRGRKIERVAVADLRLEQN